MTMLDAVVGGAFPAEISSKKVCRSVSYEVRQDVLLRIERRDGCMS